MPGIRFTNFEQQAVHFDEDGMRPHESSVQESILRPWMHLLLSLYIFCCFCIFVVVVIIILL